MVEIVGSGALIPLTRNLLDSIRLAYCISLHKAQGSQFPRVIIPLSKSRLIDRQWLYTAITRAENEVHLVGPRNRLIEAIEKESVSKQKKTSLRQIISSVT